MATFACQILKASADLDWVRCVCPGEEEQGSIAEVSYYSYEYDSDSEPFLADAEGGDRYDLSDSGKYVKQKVVLPADAQISSTETKNVSERWYDLCLFCSFLFFSDTFGVLLSIDGRNSVHSNNVAAAVDLFQSVIVQSYNKSRVFLLSPTESPHSAKPYQPPNCTYVNMLVNGKKRETCSV